MRVLGSADYKRMPWKNGGGETIEVAIHPRSAGLGDFDWRLSIAGVNADGSFSTFEGIDRTLCILDGAGLDLVVGQAPPMRLDQESPPFSFPADAETHAALASGPVSDFNLMTRRSKFGHRLQRLSGEGTVEVESHRTTFLIPDRGRCSVSCAAGTALLDTLDCILFEGFELEVTLRGASGMRVLFGEIEAR